MMTAYQNAELERAKEVERKGIARLGSAWIPSRWHIKIYLKEEAEERKSLAVQVVQRRRKAFSRTRYRSWRRRGA